MKLFHCCSKLKVYNESNVYFVNIIFLNIDTQIITYRIPLLAATLEFYHHSLFAKYVFKSLFFNLIPESCIIILSHAC